MRSWGTRPPPQPRICPRSCRTRRALSPPPRGAPERLPRPPGESLRRRKSTKRMRTRPPRLPCRSSRPRSGRCLWGPPRPPPNRSHHPVPFWGAGPGQVSPRGPCPPPCRSPPPPGRALSPLATLQGAPMPKSPRVPPRPPPSSRRKRRPWGGSHPAPSPLRGLSRGLLLSPPALHPPNSAKCLLPPP